MIEDTDDALAGRTSELLQGLAVVREIAAGTPDGDALLWEDAVFQRCYRELEIDLLGVVALEQQLGSRLPADIAAAVLSHRQTGCGERLAALTIQVLGYYALPDPDPLLIDNEGPIGHDWALPAMRSVAAYFEPAASAHEGGIAQKNIIARGLFNQQPNLVRPGATCCAQ